MLPILVFDLDDTLYPEITYVESGIAAVSIMLAKQFHFDPANTRNEILKILKKNGRGKIFDTFLQSKGLMKKSYIDQCITTFHHHTPSINISNQNERLLSGIQSNCYLVTDGNKVVQRKKIKALGVDKFFKKFFITYQYGIKYSKPSLFCFNKIIEMERIGWHDLVYIGDNPAKDFVNLNNVGAQTVRILTGEHKNKVATKKFDAKLTINNLNELRDIYGQCFSEE